MTGLLFPGALRAEPVAVRHAEGLVRGFLVRRSLDGTFLANGDLIQTSRGDRVTSRLIFHFKDGSIQDETGMSLPADLANGIVLTLLKNIAPEAASTEASMLAATPEPRLVKLLITPAGEDSFSASGASHKAVRFNVKVELGGVAGLIAPIIGRQPHDTSVWILSGEAPGFVKSEGPMYQGGPLWRIELASPLWPR